MNVNTRSSGESNRFGASMVAFTMVIAIVAGPAVAADDPTVRIGIVRDGVSARDIGYVDVLKEEITTIVQGNYTVVFPEDAEVHGDWTRTGVAEAIETMVNRPDLDLVIAVGIEAASAACSLEERSTPIVASAAFAECVQGCVESVDFRVNTIDFGQMVSRDLAAFHQVVPFETITVLTEPAWIEDCDLVDLAMAVAPEGTEVRFASVAAGGTKVGASLPEDTEAVYMMPLRHLDEEGLVRLMRDLAGRGIPVFSILEEDVELGALASLNTEATLTRFARSTALDVFDVLDDRMEERQSQGVLGQRPTVNMETARTLGVDLSWEVLSDARLLRQEVARSGRPIDLGAAIDRAVEANLVLLVEDRQVAAGAEDIREARANYRPKLDVALSGVQIDENHAIAALGQYPRFASGSVQFTQLIYSDAASANITAQKEIQAARLADRESLRLDIVRSTVSAYLGLMRAEAGVRIRQADVDLNRSNLDLARLRHSAGAAGIAEVYRWEAQQAAARAALLEASSFRRQAERQLSRLLDRPITSQWEAARPDLGQGLATIGGAEQAPMLDNPNGYDAISLVLLDQGLANAPELAALDAVISAQERAYTAAKRAYYAPTVGVSARVDHVLAKDTSGGLDLGDIGDLIPEFDDTSWNVGVQASLPVTTGGENKARRLKAKEELYGLRLDRRNAEELISQRILSALDDAASSWPAISLYRQSADAAGKTLELVQDAYGRGAASILDLLDAQNAALSAEFAAETAVYEFLDDWAEVQRAVADLGPVRPMP